MTALCHGLETQSNLDLLSSSRQREIHHAAYEAQKRVEDGRDVIVGVNMPMLLDFVFHRDQSLSELVPRLVDRGRRGIAAVTP